MRSANAPANKNKKVNMMAKKLYRSKKDRKLAGVCAGLAEYFGFDPTWARLALLFLVLFCGTGVLAYIICALVIPEQPGEIPTEN